MTEFQNRMNILNKNKNKIIEFILQNNFDLILDLGAGTCVIEQNLPDHIHKIAIEKNPLNIQINNTEIICDDIIHALKNKINEINQYKSVCVILSAVLHELNKTQLRQLSNLLNQIQNKTIYIREPLITDCLITEPFQVIDSPKFNEYKSLHSWNEEITFINYCFLISYGENSWDREKLEGRFTFTFEEMVDFIEKCGVSITKIFMECDEFYKQTLPYDMYDKIHYTGNLIIAKKGGN